MRIERVKRPLGETLTGRKFRMRQKFFRGIWLCVFAALPVWAQSVSPTAVSEVFAPERLALVDLSGNTLNQSQSQAMLAALAQICREESHIELAADTALAADLEKRPNFSILVADNARALCQALSIDYLVALKFESISPVAAPAPSSLPTWQITLRWIDGGTGQMTKTVAREFAGNINAPESFPLRGLFRALLESPEVILPVDNLLVEMPAMDSTVATTPALQNRRGRHWLWYFTGAAVLSGGSAMLLLRKSSNNGSAGKTLLPEPPDPPK
ncbi:MAG: hypothetical protein ACREOI_20390 [bacterium]